MKGLNVRAAGPPPTPAHSRGHSPAAPGVSRTRAGDESELGDQAGVAAKRFEAEAGGEWAGSARTGLLDVQDTLLGRAGLVRRGRSSHISAVPREQGRR